MIATLLITLLLKGIVAVVYSVWHRRPVTTILLTSVLGNLLTQSILWIVLMLSFRHYLVALVIAEIMIWGIESFLLHGVPANQLTLKDAVLLSLGMNELSLVLIPTDLNSPIKSVTYESGTGF